MQLAGQPSQHPGMALTPEERSAHRDRMRGMQSREECLAYVAEHHAQMMERAKAKGPDPARTAQPDVRAPSVRPLTPPTPPVLR